MDLSKPERLYQIARKIVAVPCAVEAVPAITPAPSAFVANLSNVLPPYASARGIGIAQQAGALLYEALKLGAFPKRRKLRNLITAHISAERATGDPHWVWNVQVLVWLEAVRGRYALLRDSERESQEPWVSDCRHIAALLLAEAKRLADTPAPGNEIGGAGTPVENQPQVKPVAGEGTAEQDERSTVWLSLTACASFRRFRLRPLVRNRLRLYRDSGGLRQGFVDGLGEQDAGDARAVNSHRGGILGKPATGRV